MLGFYVIFSFDYIDVIGIIDTCSNTIPFTNRTSNRDSVRREITLMDESATAPITLWDEQVNRLNSVFSE